MPRSIVGQSILSRRRGLIGWSLGVAALTALTAGFWPAAPESEQLEALIEGVPEALLALFGAAEGDLFSPAGYLDSQLFSLLSPLLLLIFGVTGAANAIAGEEERGRLELLLAIPVSRARILLERAAAVLGMVAWLTAVHFAVLALTAALVGLDIGLGNLAAMHVSLLLLVAAVTALTLAVGAGTGRRGLAVGTAGVVAVAGYLVDSFAPLVSWLESIQALSPFYLYRGNQPLVNGVDPVHAGVLVGLAASLIVLGIVAFDRRDIGV